MSAEPRKPAMLAMKITAPSLRTAISGRTRLESQSALLTLFAKTRSNASSVRFCSGPKSGLAPTLLTRMSIVPKATRVFTTSSSSCALSPTWQGIAIARPPVWRIVAATSSQASALRLEITTRAPQLAMASAMARPMPRDEPVTTAVLSLRSKRRIPQLPRTIGYHPITLVLALSRRWHIGATEPCAPRTRSRPQAVLGNIRGNGSGTAANGRNSGCRGPVIKGARCQGDQPRRRGSFHEPRLRDDAAPIVHLCARRIRCELRAIGLCHGRVRLFLGKPANARGLRRRSARLGHSADRRARALRYRRGDHRPRSGLLGAHPRLCMPWPRKHDLSPRRLRDPLAWRERAAHGASLFDPHLPRHGGSGRDPRFHARD